MSVNFVKLLILLILLIISISCTTQEPKIIPHKAQNTIEILSIENNAPYDRFAQCLTNKNITMYGSIGCSHCQRVKDTLGDSFQYIQYYECNPRAPNNHAKICYEKNVQAFPGWELKDNNFFYSSSLKQVAEKAGCALP